MKCPACSNVLRKASCESGLLRVCTNCKGIWFEAGQFADFIRRLSAKDEVPFDKIKLFEHRDALSKYELKEDTRLCPQCGEELRKINYASDSNVFVDRCPGCGGIWADGGEVVSIASYVKSDPRAIVAGTAIVRGMKQTEELKQRVSEGRTGEVNVPLVLPRVVVPFSDDAPRNRFPIVTVAMIGLGTVAFVLRMVADPGSLLNEGVGSLFDVISFSLAQGGPLHLAWNMLFLWLFGDNVEDCLGRVGYLVFLLFCSLAGSGLYTIFGSGSSALVAGVSGAVSAVMGAYFIFHPVANVRLFAVYGTMNVPAVLCLGAWFIVQLIAPFLSEVSSEAMGIFLANIFGFLAGAVVAFFAKDRLNYEG